MHTPAERNTSEKQPEAANKAPDSTANRSVSPLFADNRPDVVRQQKIQELAQNSVSQRKALQWQALADSHSDAILQKKSSLSLNGWPNKPVTQFALRSYDQFNLGLTANEAQQAALTNIADSLRDYNEIDAGADEDFQLRLGALKLLLRNLHVWFDTFKTGALDAVPNAVYLKTFYADVEREHKDLIAQVAVTDHLPVHTDGMVPLEVEKVRQIWLDLLNNSGNIEIRDSAAGFRQSMLAAFARLLEGQFGRNMLTDLNTDRGCGEQKIIVASHFGPELGAEDRAESEAVPRSMLDKSRENAHKMVGSSKDNVRDDLPEYDQTGEDFDPAAFHDFLTGHDDSRKVKWGGEALKKGVGTGSLVRVLPEGGHLIGEDDSQILMPDFVTLGHELGHAQRLLRGAPLHNESMDKMGVTDGADQLLWNNPEEYVNINAVENRIRGEHGLSNRKYHAGDLNTVRFARAQAAFEKRVGDFREAVDMFQNKLLNHHPGNRKIQDYMTVKPDYGDPEVVARINEELDDTIRDSNNPAALWQIAGNQVKHDPQQLNVMSLGMGILAPHMTAGILPGLNIEVIYALVKYCIKVKNWDHVDKIADWMASTKNFNPLVMAMDAGALAPFLTHGLSKKGYLKADPGLAKIPALVQASRTANDWRVIKALMLDGHKKIMFVSGLTPEEFESKVDPAFEIDVEIEYDTPNPSGWFSKLKHHVYVRKNMRREKDK